MTLKLHEFTHVYVHNQGKKLYAGIEWLQSLTVLFTQHLSMLSLYISLSDEGTLLRKHIFVLSNLLMIDILSINILAYKRINKLDE